MKQLIYSVYVILPVLLLWGAKFSKGKEFNDGFLSLEQTKAFQGFLAICIMLHHIAQKTCASWIKPAGRIVHGLDIFVDMGFLLVSVFLFFNGYGVYKSFHSKDNYSKREFFLLSLLFTLQQSSSLSQDFLLVRKWIQQKRFSTLQALSSVILIPGTL